MSIVYLALFFSQSVIPRAEFIEQFKKCQSLVVKQDFKQAKHSYRALVSLAQKSGAPEDRKDWEVRCRLQIAICDVRLNYRKAAVTELKKILADHPRHGWSVYVLRELGQIQLDEWMLDEAIVNLKAALALALKDDVQLFGKRRPIDALDIIEIRMNLARALIQNDQDDRGREELRAGEIELEKWWNTNRSLPKASPVWKEYWKYYVLCEIKKAEIDRRGFRTFDSISRQRALLARIDQSNKEFYDDGFIIKKVSVCRFLAQNYLLIYRFADAMAVLDDAAASLKQLAEGREKQALMGQIKGARALVQVEVASFNARRSLEPLKFLPNIDAAAATAIEAQKFFNEESELDQGPCSDILNTRRIIEEERGRIFDAASLPEESLQAYEQAFEHANKAIRLAEILFQPHHDVVLMMRGRRASLSWKLSKKDEAHQELVQALAQLEVQHGTQWLDSSLLRAPLIEIETSLGNVEKARLHADAHRHLIANSLMAFASRMTAVELSRLIRDFDDEGFHASLRLGVSNVEIWQDSAEWLINGKAREVEVFGEASRRSENPADFGMLLAEQAFEVYGQPFNQDSMDRIEKKKRDVALTRKGGMADWRKVSGLPIDADEVYIDCFCVRDANNAVQEYYAWLITGDRAVQVIRLGDARTIDQRIQEFTDEIERFGEAQSSAGPGRLEKQFQQDHLIPLSELLFEPIQKAVGDRPKWIVSPDGPLWNVPWPALLTSDGKYAIESVAFRFVVSGRDLYDRVAPKLALGPALILAGPDFDEIPTGFMGSMQRNSNQVLGRFEKVDALQQEGQMVAEAIGAVPMMGKQATKKALLGGSLPPRVLYIATHGFSLEQKQVLDPFLWSGIALAGGNLVPKSGKSLPGLLTAAEVLCAPVKGTELVVLSACRTSRGLNEYGSSSSSLRHAFHLAGARSVVGSLWSVQARATGELMSNFMQNVAAGEDKAIALQKAQTTMIGRLKKNEGHSHPFFWAAFTLSGF